MGYIIKVKRFFPFSNEWYNFQGFEGSDKHPYWEKDYCNYCCARVWKTKAVATRMVNQLLEHGWVTQGMPIVVEEVN